MKIIRKFEDFDGLENGKGLRLSLANEVRHGELYEVLVLYVNDFGYRSFEVDETDKIEIDFIKAMGFEFEWKPKRTLEEVLADYKSIPFVKRTENYLIVQEESGLYRVGYCYYNNWITCNYYSKKDAEKICDELNS